jgi:hypothetical protein
LLTLRAHALRSLPVVVFFISPLRLLFNAVRVE